MRRWLVVLAIAITLLLLGFVPISQSYALMIKAPYFNVYQSLTLSKNWLRWSTAFKENQKTIVRNTPNGFTISGPQTKVDFQKGGINEFHVDVKQGAGFTSQNCYLEYGAGNNSVKATVISKTYLFNYIWSFIAGSSVKETSIQDLKRYVEDSRRYYGFDIRESSTSNKLLVIKRGKLLTASVSHQNKIMLKQLKDFIIDRGLLQNAPVQLQYISTVNDSSEVMIGIPVNKSRLNGSEFMAMSGGNILVGHFKGIYRNRQRLYAAMQTYVADHYFHPYTKPFEIFTSDQLPESDESKVDMKVVILYM